jgi:hypothetical protein
MQCLPFSGGWAEQPECITMAINLFRVEQSRWEQEEREKELAKARQNR